MRARGLVSKMLREANDVYPDQQIKAYFNLTTGEERDFQNPNAGDTLALFIGREISEIVGDDMTVKQARAVVESALTRAAEELDDVIAHFRGTREV